MKILVDIGHPAHIHYFKNVARILIHKGHQFLFVVRERDSTIELIESTGFDYVSRGKGKKGIINKLFALPVIDYKMYKIAKVFHPDILLSFSSPYAAHVSKLIGKPHIAFDDTEHAKFEHWMCRPFTDVVLSPSCYNAKLWKNQMLFNSFMELLYLHPNYFQPDNSVLDHIGVKKGEKYCILRFISWDANHDVGQYGLSYQEKVQLVQSLSKISKVFISSEIELNEELKPYQLKIHPKELHHLLYYASLYIGEGGTTASEAAVLGTPAIYINTLEAGLFDEEQERGLLYHLKNLKEIVECADKILCDSNSEEIYNARRQKLLSEKLDPTAFLVWFLENYPESKHILRDNPNYQQRFLTYGI